ncbi:MAG: ribonuclease H-like domain-containing protein [archaeon]
MKIGFFDTEVKKSPKDVGWDNYKQLGISVGCVVEKTIEITNNKVDISSTSSHSFVDDPSGMVEKLNFMDMVVGYNNKSFDDNLICEFTGKDQGFLINNFDIQEYLDNKTGIKYCTGLDSLARYTLNEGKPEDMDGAKAPKLWQKYKQNNNHKALIKLNNYCLKDCFLTSDVFVFGLKYGYVLIRPNKNEELFGNMALKINVDWKNLIDQKEIII